MKKITFVEKDDNSSYDPVNTFFSKQKAPSVGKPPINTSKQSAWGIKTPIEKRIQDKKQQKVNAEKVREAVSQKIGQKGGSGYIPKKAPGFNTTSYERLKQQNTYQLKQKQKRLGQNIKKSQQKVIGSKNNFQADPKPDMVFDVSPVGFQEDQFRQQILEEGKAQNTNKLPEIKSPNSNLKNMPQTSSKIKPPFLRQDKNTKNVQKSSSSIKEQQIDQIVNQKRTISKEIPSAEKPMNPKSKIQSSKSRQSSNISKPGPSQQVKANLSAQKIPPKDEKNEQIKVKQKSTGLLQERVKQLESYQKEYTSKIEYLEQRIEGLTKIEQKYNKLLKEHKQCNQKSKDMAQLSQQLAQAKESIQKLMSQPSVPYSKKRELLLLNQINQLKRTNRQLVLRIKSYKGTDLVEMAISRNKEQIGREFEIDYHEEPNQLNVQMEANLAILIRKVYDYLDMKTGKHKKTQEDMTFDKEQKFLLDINSLAQKLSLTYLEKYQVSPLPKCNQDCTNLYAQIQNEKQNLFKTSLIDQVVNKEELNFAITENNLQILNDCQSNVQQMIFLEQKVVSLIKPDQKEKTIVRPTTSHGPQSKNINKNIIKKASLLLDIYKQRSFISTAFHIQSICYFTFLKEIINKKLKKLQNQLVNLNGRLKQIKEIFDVGGNSARQSLYLYMQTNLQNFYFLVPNLECKIKEIRSSYSQISKGLQRKMQIKQL